jgi:phosphatidate cytidylyltransferase
MMLAWFGDTGGYFGGRFFGRRKLSARISPNKTVEGLVGSVIASLCGGLAAHAWYLPELPLAHAVVLGVAVGALGQAGDLFESLIKRSVGAKDSGWIVPGHGGLLDRIDGLLFTSAGTWLYTVCLSR